MPRRHHGGVTTNNDALPQPPLVEMVFLGTASMVSSPTRHVAGIGVVIGGDCWIFDAGEGTGTQLAKSSVLQSAVSRVFVTHMHGDHVFGLMGLLLSVGSTGDPRTIQVDIVVPSTSIVHLTNECKARLLHDDNQAFLKAQGVANPLSVLSRLQHGHAVELADGILAPDDVVTERRLGRRLAILGDTCDSRAVARLAVHECTNAFVESLDGGGHTSSEQVEAATYVHGHSTPRTAGRFAQAIQCRHLILTHFSRRYKDDGSMEPVMDTIRRQCGAQYDAGKIECAHDLEVVTVKIPKEDRYTDADQAYKDAATAADEAKAHAQAFFHAHESLLLQLSRRSRRLLE
ncbi:hypothetical protein DYB31_007048 [Aphanomyces astaci]|uniref:Metallo-beta-lactamase domain-containing protein n=2 Tax=Aphanomyces astaci TaxID=112090 RepID=A0A397FHH5_APHAT|nr:hypothetical protein DYB31_007048 [Aphanomyces astaci]